MELVERKPVAGFIAYEVTLDASCADVAEATKTNPIKIKRHFMPQFTKTYIRFLNGGPAKTKVSFGRVKPGAGMPEG
ncbi:MAG: hypothetical protein K1X47_13875 [Cyclobacteriaceae bacterium]|nr:hypothetical protein [Cyclobacteriaceae bacterium]